MEENKKVKSRFEENKKGKKLSIHERWEQDSDALFESICKGRISRTVEEKTEIKKEEI